MKKRLLSLWMSVAPGQRKLMVWCVSLVLFYTIFGFLVLPWIVKAVAVSQISKQLNRETTIRQVRINPYVLSGTIRGLLVKDKDGEPFISFEEAYANFQLASFFGKPWVFKEVWTVKPYCRVQINPDYSLNFSDLAQKFSQASAAPKKPGQPLYLHIGKFQIIGASASFTDLTLSKPFQRLIGPLQINMTEFHTDPNNLNPYSFVGTTDSGEKFSWSGQFSLDPLQSAGDLSLEGLSIPKYAPLFQDLVRFDIKDGVVDGRATYQFSLIGSNYFATVTNASGSLRSLKMTERGGSNDLVELDRLAIAGVSANASARTAQIGEIEIEGGRLAVKRNRDESINLLELSEPAAGTTNAPGGVLFLLRAATNAFTALIQSTNHLAATLHQLQVTNCSIHWEDEATPRPVHLTVDDIAFSAQHLSNIAGSNQTAQLSIRWNTNGVARVNAGVQLAPPAADVTLKVSDMDLRPLDPYLEPFLNLFLIGSKVGVDGNLRMRQGTNGLPEVSFHGDARLDDFATVDRQTQQLLKWKSVQLTGLEANLQPPTVALKEMSIVEPSARVALDTNQTLNFLTVLKTPATNGADTVSTAAESKAPEKKARLGQRLGSILRQALASNTNLAGSVLPKVSVDHITITNGFVQFDDLSVQPSVSGSVQDLNGYIAGVSSEELKRADLHFSGKAVRTGPIELTGKINPLNRNAPTQITITFRDVDLSPASPYSGKFLGYRLNRGRLGLEADYEVSERRVKAKNVVVLDQLTLGEKVPSPDATKLPVKLAIALLKDRNGKIEIELPIDGNLDDPDFHIGKVVVHVLVNVMTKIVTSPFAALGALFGGKGEEVSYVDFAAGSTQLQAAGAAKLDTLVSGLYERPGLELQIEGSFDPVADGDGLRKQKLEHRFREQKWATLRKSEQARVTPDQVALTPEEYAARLQTAYDAVLRASAASNATATASSSAARAIASPTTESSGDSSEQKGATALLQRSSSQPKATADEKERLVFRTIPIADADLIQLATERARSTQQHILGTGKVDASRLFLVDLAANPPTNRVSRVYFHLQ